MVLGLWRNYCQALLSKESIRGNRNGKTTVGPAGFLSFKCQHPNVHFFIKIFYFIFILINIPVGTDREVFGGRGSSANDEAFLSGITAFLTRYYSISYQILLYFFPSFAVFVQFSSAGQWTNLFLHPSPTASQWLTRMGMSGPALSAGKLPQMQKPK